MKRVTKRQLSHRLPRLVSAAPSSPSVPRTIQPEEIAAKYGLPLLHKRDANPRYSRIVVFGDSYSANNRSAQVYTEKQGYYAAAESNGAPAVEIISYLQGVPLINYAVSGAHITGDTGISVDEKIRQHLSELKNGQINLGSARTLYFIMIGFNPIFLDFRLSSAWNSDPPADPSPLYNQAASRARDLFRSIQQIESARGPEGNGRFDYYLVGPPQQDLVPGTRVECIRGPAATAQKRCEYFAGMDNAFNQQLTSGSVYLNAGLQGVGRTSQAYDIGGLWRDFHNRPSNYGYKVVDTSCLPIDNNTGPICASPDDYLYWNGLHPSKRGHFNLGFALNPWINRTVG